MENKKLRKNIHEVGTQISTASDDYSPTEDKDPADYSSMEKRKTKKMKSIMQIQNTKMGVSRKPKNLKSKDKQACAKNSKKTGSIKRRTGNNDLYDNIEAKFSVMERADRLLERLEHEHELELPFFLKCMLPSNVSHGFWLHLPRKFCRVHLPDDDTSIILVDEWGNEYKTSYILGRHGLSAGWRGFAIAHRLLKGDVLIFHLTGPCKLQVHIVRVNGSDVVSAAFCLMNLDASRGGIGAGDFETKDKRKRKRTTKYVEPFLPYVPTQSENVEAENVQDQSTSNTDGFSSEVIEDSEIAVRPRSEKALCCPEPSILLELPPKSVVCT